MQHGALEAGRTRRRGIDMQRIHIPVQPIQQRAFRTHGQIADDIRLRFRHGRRRGKRRIVRLTACGKTAIAATEVQLLDACQHLTVRRIDHIARHQHLRALAFALVDDRLHARAPDDRRGGGQGPQKRHALLAMHHLHVIDAALGVAHPLSGKAEHGGHRRRDGHLRAVGELQRARVERIDAEANAQRIQSAIALGVGLVHVVERPVLQFLIIDRQVGLRRVTPGPS